MLEITKNIWLTVLIIPLVLFLYALFEKSVVILIEKYFKRNNAGFLLFIEKSIVIFFNILLIFFLNREVFNYLNFNSKKIGTSYLLISLLISFIMGMITLITVKMEKDPSTLENFLSGNEKGHKFFIFLTLALLVGPAEDLFFIGIVQASFIKSIKIFSVFVYMIIFTFYHYINVIQGVESKKEFLISLPFRLLISGFLGLSFYHTKSLLYPMIIHNIFDTVSYISFLIGKKLNKQT